MSKKIRITKTGDSWAVRHSDDSSYVDETVATYTQARDLAEQIAKANTPQHDITKTVDDIARAARRTPPNTPTLDYEDADDTSTRQGKVWQQWELDYVRHAIKRNHGINLICEVLERKKTAVEYKITTLKREGMITPQRTRITRSRWTADEHDYLVSSTQAGATVEEQADLLGRTTEAIRRRRRDIQHNLNNQH